MDSLSRAFSNADTMIELARSKAAGSSASMLTSGMGGVPTTIPGLADARSQYAHGSRGWAFVAARAIATRLAGQDVFIGRIATVRTAAKKDVRPPRGLKSVGDRLEPLTSHPFITALNSPNQLHCRWQLIYSLAMSLELAGIGFLWWSGGGQIWYVPASWVRPGDSLNGPWIIRPARSAAEFTVPGTDICFVSLPDPADPFGTLSPLQSQSHAVAVDEQIQTAQHRSFRNGVFPQLMIKAGRLPGMLPSEKGELPILEPEQRRELIAAIKSTYSGARNYNEPLIVDGLIEGVERLTTAPAEMDFLDSGASVKSRILQAYGINPCILGELQNSNRAAAATAELSFCQNVLNPLAELLSQCLTRWARGQFADPNLCVWLDWFEAHDSEMELERWQAGIRAGYVTQNEYRTQILNLPAVPGGDAFLDPLTGQPRGAVDADDT